jgi:hypothetical protein
MILSIWLESTSELCRNFAEKAESACIDRGRERLSPSPPSEPCVRFSRTRLSSRWFPLRDWLANTPATINGEQPLCRKEDINYMPPMTPLSSAANMRSLHSEAFTHDQSRPRVSAPCVVLSDTGGAWLSLCLFLCGTHVSTFLPPVPRRSFAFCASRSFRRCGTMKALTPTPLTTHSAGLPAYLTTPSCRSVSNHVGCLIIAYHHASVTSEFRTSP